MFTLRSNKNIVKRMMFIYLGVTLFCALFGLIYEMNAHGVYSFYMAFGFIFPMTLGLFIYCLLFFFEKVNLPSVFSSNLYNAGVATLSMGIYFQGALDIYGTTRDIYFIIYVVVGITLICIGFLSYIITLITLKKEK